MAYESVYAFYPVSNINAQSYQKVAQEIYCDSLNNRSSWPHHWVDLALVKRYDMFELACTMESNDRLLKKYCERRNYDGLDLHIEPDIASNRFN